MKYLGSKNRISKYIVPIIQKAIDDNGIENYYEPFAGGMNMIDKIQCKNRIANDVHPELIAMWKALQDGWLPPPHISEDEYNYVKNNQTTLPPYYVGYVGFNASFGARYFQGYARGFKNDGITPRDMSNEAYRNIMKQLSKLHDVSFMCGDYRKICVDNSVIYCDPPYENTKGYYSTIALDYDEFWSWCKQQSNSNILFVSSYDAPDDWGCIWQKGTVCNFDSQRNENSNKQRTEKLFVLKGDVCDELCIL